MVKIRRQGAGSGEAESRQEPLKSLRRFRMDHIRRALQLAANDGERAAEALGITVRELDHFRREIETTKSSGSPERGTGAHGEGK